MLAELLLTAEEEETSVVEGCRDDGLSGACKSTTCEWNEEECIGGGGGEERGEEGGSGRVDAEEEESNRRVEEQRWQNMSRDKLPLQYRQYKRSSE